MSFLLKLFANLGISRLKFAIYGAVILGILSALGTVYLKGRLDCSAAYKNQSLKNQIKLLRASNRALLEDAKQRGVDVKDLEKLQKKIDDLVSKADDAECLPGPLSERVRDLW